MMSKYFSMKENVNIQNGSDSLKKCTFKVYPNRKDDYQKYVNKENDK